MRISTRNARRIREGVQAGQATVNAALAQRPLPLMPSPNQDKLVFSTWLTIVKRAQERARIRLEAERRAYARAARIRQTHTEIAYGIARERGTWSQ